jgi:hypothetical protein
MPVVSLTTPGFEQLDATEAISVARSANDFVAIAVGRLAVRQHTLPDTSMQHFVPNPDRAIARMKIANSLG